MGFLNVCSSSEPKGPLCSTSWCPHYTTHTNTFTTTNKYIKPHHTHTPTTHHTHTPTPPHTHTHTHTHTHKCSTCINMRTWKHTYNLLHIFTYTHKHKHKHRCPHTDSHMHTI